MDQAKVDLLIRYALAVAALEDFPHRQLGPLHVLKYVYLADLAYAEKHGQTYTGARWVFYDFGPWSLAVQERIGDAAKGIGASVIHLRSEEDKEFVRYEVHDRGLRDRMERELPIAVSRAIDRSVRRFGASTPALLDHVYLTEPLRLASPGETLRFPTKADGSSVVRETSESRPSAKELKRRREKVRSLKERVRAFKADRTDGARATSSPPRYDDVFSAGREWLDAQLPEAIDNADADLVVDPSVWKSSFRTDGDLP
jgi:hypothetical protein